MLGQLTFFFFFRNWSLGGLTEAELLWISWGGCGGAEQKHQAYPDRRALPSSAFSKESKV